MKQPTVAAICSQCAIWCHEKYGHEVRNIGAKKGIRCDCGNEDKFGSCSSTTTTTKLICSLNPDKDYRNNRNDYSIINKNGLDKWCYCEREEIRPMIQCIACENW